MFNNNKFLSNSHKFMPESNFNNYLNNSINKFIKLMEETNKIIKKNKEMKYILNTTKTDELIENDLIHVIKYSKYYNFFFIVSLVSVGALVSTYKNKK